MPVKFSGLVATAVSFNSSSLVSLVKAAIVLGFRLGYGSLLKIPRLVAESKLWAKPFETDCMQIVCT